MLPTRSLLVSLFALFAGPAWSQDTSAWVRLPAEDPDALSDRLHAEGFDVIEVGPGHLELIVTPGERKALEAGGLELEVVRFGRPLLERDDVSPGAAPVPPGYPDLAGIYAQMQATAAAYPSIAAVVDLTATYGTPPTHEGRNLFAMKLSDNVNVDEDEPSFLMVSTHHSREIVTPVIALHAIEQLTEQYGTDPGITAALDRYEVWIAPVWNPDGYEYVVCCDDLWRKNRRDNGNGTFGVDLNRNYPFGWTSSCSGSNNTSSSTYRGPASASEPETQTMLAFGADRRFTKLYDYHSFAEEVRYGYGCFNHPFDPWLQAEAAAFSQSGGYGGNTAPSCCSGGNFAWHIAEFGTHSFLWETASSFNPSYASAQSEAALVWPGALEMLKRPIPLEGHVTDACSGAPLAAALSFPGVAFQNGEVNGSGGPFGRYHAFMPEGSYTARFSLEGYAIQDIPVTITAAGLTLDVALVPQPPAVAYCTAGTSASGCAATLSATGTPSASQPSGFLVQAANVEGDKDGLFYFGTGGRQANPWGSGTSFQCVAPPVARGGLLVGTGSAGACDGSFSQDLNARWTAVPAQNPGAGVVVQTQLWYRDPLNTSNQTTSLSDAIEFTTCP